MRKLQFGLSMDILLLVIGTLALFASVSCQSTLEDEGITVHFNISKDAVLTCTVENLGRRRLIWRRLSDRYPISVGGTRFSPKRRFRVTTKGETSTLVIRRVGFEDSGEYMCEASGGAGPRKTLILNIRGGDDRTYFLPTNTTVKAAVGDMVLLPCHVENINNRVVLWKDGRNEILSLRKKRLSGDHRQRIIHNIRTEWSLQIKRVNDDDFGYYTCVVNSDPVLTRTVELQNQEPTRFAPVLIADDSFQKKVEVKAGQPATLKCNFNAYPKPKVTWFKRKRDSSGKATKTELGKGTTYTLRAASVSDAGDYICEGDNGSGKVSRGKTRLIVIAPHTTVPPTTTQFTPTGPASPRLYHKHQTITERRARSTTLECIGVGDPVPTLSWRKDGHTLKDDYKYNLIQTYEGKYRSILKLEIISLVNRDYGTYECVGHNNLGLISIDFHLRKPS